MYNYPGGLFIKKSYDYAFMEFDFFNVREVVGEGGPTGEYHICINDGSSLENAIHFFRRQFSGQNIGLVDPSGDLKLDYPIYLIIEDELIKSAAPAIFEAINTELTKSK